MTEDSLLFDRQVRQLVYEITLNRGIPPSLQELSARSAVPVDDVREACKRLADSHMLVLQPETAEILMATPFSAVPTPFRVHTDRFDCFGNCIWDALGIAAMLRREVLIGTSCADCGYSMELSISGGTLADSEGIVHFALPARRWWDNIVFT